LAKDDAPKTMGRPRIELDWKEFDKLCAIHCTLVEIAGWFNCSEDTIERRVVETHGVTFAEYFKIKSAKGKISLRRSQFKLSERNPGMAIWLGKQYLEQTDNYDMVLSQKPQPVFDTAKMSRREYLELVKEQLSNISQKILSDE
jgi:hypothetical protein